MAGGLQPTVSQSKGPPASAPTAFTRFRRKKRELGIGPPEQGRLDPGLVLRGQYIAARPRHYPGVKAMGAKENSPLPPLSPSAAAQGAPRGDRFNYFSSTFST